MSNLLEAAVLLDVEVDNGGGGNEEEEGEALPGEPGTSLPVTDQILLLIF